MKTLRPTPDDTKVFKNGMKLVRAKQLMEEDNAFFSGLFSTPLLLGTALAWLIIGSIFMSVPRDWSFVSGWVCITIATVLVCVWATVHVVPVAFPVTVKAVKKFVDFVCKPVL